MAPTNPNIMQAVEQLGYRVTVGDVATKAGLNVELAQQGLLALASDAGGHMQVAESGDVVYLFPKDFQAVLRNKYLQIQLQEWWQKVWKVLFYIIRISFGVVLITSIVLIYLAIMIIIMSSKSGDNDNDSGDFGGGFFYFPDLFWYLSPDYGTNYQERKRENSDLNFLEAIFSFLFGDGNPNADLEKRRWQQIAAVIRKNGNAVVAEQIAPYLDDLGEVYEQEYEDYMLPVLTRFNGKPEVSPTGQLVYYFPDLQVTVNKKRQPKVPVYLQELPWRFSAATSGQVMLSAGLGVVNFVGALVLGGLLRNGVVAAQVGGLVGFVQGIYWILLAYGIGFLGIPLVRYFWVQWRNGKISERNSKRQARARLLASVGAELQDKIAFAQQFASQKVISNEDLIYSTEHDALEQEFERPAQIEEEKRESDEL